MSVSNWGVAVVTAPVGLLKSCPLLDPWRFLFMSRLLLFIITDVPNPPTILASREALKTRLGDFDRLFLRSPDLCWLELEGVELGKG